MKSIILSFLFFLSIPLFASSAEMPSDTTYPLIRKSSFVILPLIFYTPETRLAGGGAALYAFRFRNQPDSARPSQVQIGGAYTQENQILSYLPFQLFFKNSTYNIYGELGYYRYFYYFYGIGNDLPDTRERYSAQYPRIRLNALKKVYPNLYVGVRYSMDNYNIPEVEVGGKLADNTITGSQGGLISNIGVVANYDSRDNIFYATKGYNVELALLNNGKWLGSDFNFNRISLDATTYWTNRYQHTLAVNGWFNFNFGDVPFNEMAVIGGTKKMRGFFEGRYRDNHVWMLQTEYRVPPIWWRLGFVVFGSVGSVANQISDFTESQIHYSGGAGLRILLSKKEKINIRIDYGINEKGEGFPYITVTEAF
jgi:outer membrane protein assembly factor BamA